MGHADYYKRGDWNSICYVCGRKFKASELLKHWQGYYVCTEDYEPRHPQDFVRSTPDRMAVPWNQSPPTESFVTMCTLEGRSAIADRAIADCAIADLFIIFDHNGPQP